MNTRAFSLCVGLLVVACDDAPKEPSDRQVSAASSASTEAPAETAFEPRRVDLQADAMGTKLHLVSYTTPDLSEDRVRAAMQAAMAEVDRLAKLLSDWTDDSDVGRINHSPGEFVKVAPETLEVVEKGLWAGKVSEGTFDITWNSLGGLWKFGDAREADPKPPSAAEIKRLLPRVNYSRVEIKKDPPRVKVPKDSKLGLGGIAKGYIVDKMAAAMRKGHLSSFLVQAGGDLYGAGRKPDGAPWVSGIQDPRGKEGKFFAVIELTDHAFSTAGDYARAYIHGGRRYHHIIDPRTGYPASASRSVTIWAPSALLADAIDDAVFILGPEKGLELVEGTDGVGAVIVTAANKVIVSRRIQGKVKITAQPSEGI
ncbi:MAG: FAD:protein FMN transferase [Myxococcales bacterium]|nr:FAD:protein FMN transferase [Myxococcales bacterium]